LGKKGEEQFLRLIEHDNGDWELQSAETRFQSKLRDFEVDLVATVHVAEKDYYEDLERDFERDLVLFELLTDEKNVEYDESLPKLKVSLYPTIEARKLASLHDLVAQLDAIDFKKPNWFLADCSTQSLKAMKETMSSSEKDTETFKIPAFFEAVLVTVIGRARKLPRFGQFARSLCWFVPCPEFHLILLDWVWGGGRPAPVLGAMVDAISAGDIVGARKLAFAQMLVSSQNATDVYGSSTDSYATIDARNAVATERIREVLDNSLMTTNTNKTKLAVLYGGSHCPGLSTNFQTRLNLEKKETKWRTVWRVTKRNENWIARFGFVPFLLFVDGVDWADTLDFIAEASTSEKLAEISLYILRHVAAYYALGKWVLEWNRDLFEDDDAEFRGTSNGILNKSRKGVSSV